MVTMSYTLLSRQVTTVTVPLSVLPWLFPHRQTQKGCWNTDGCGSPGGAVVLNRNTWRLQKCHNMQSPWSAAKHNRQTIARVQQKPQTSQHQLAVYTHPSGKLSTEALTEVVLSRNNGCPMCSDFHEYASATSKPGCRTSAGLASVLEAAAM